VRVTFGDKRDSVQGEREEMRRVPRETALHRISLVTESHAPKALLSWHAQAVSRTDRLFSSHRRRRSLLFRRRRSLVQACACLNISTAPPVHLRCKAKKANRSAFSRREIRRFSSPSASAMKVTHVLKQLRKSLKKSSLDDFLSDERTQLLTFSNT